MVIMKLINKKVVALFLSALAVLVVSVNTFGFTLLNSFWFEGRTTFRINLPAGTENQALFSAALQEAVDDWNTSSTFIFDSDTTPAPINPCLNVGINSVAFTSDVCGTAFGGQTLAVTLTTSINGASTRSIILFDESDPWRQEFDFRRVASHELGHVLGLDHSDSNQAIMFPSVGDVESPQADDIAGAAARYDIDADNVGLAIDNCPDRANALQSDIDNDGIGNFCDSDADNDGVLNSSGVDQSYEIDTQLGLGFSFGVNSSSGVLSQAQTFEVGFDSTLDSVTLPLFNCQDGTLTLEVRNLNGQNPSVLAGDVLQSADILIDSANPLTEGLVTFDLPERQYSAGQSLAIVVEHTDSCAWERSGTSPLPDYAPGSARFIPLSLPGSWFEFSLAGGPADLPFETTATPMLLDNCPANVNSDQTDSNGNGVGDACEGVAGDQDGDGVQDAGDNCPTVQNIQQFDSDGNSVGDACEGVVADVSEQICIPIRAKNGEIVMVCF